VTVAGYITDGVHGRVAAMAEFGAVDQYNYDQHVIVDERFLVSIILNQSHNSNVGKITSKYYRYIAAVPVPTSILAWRYIRYNC
jgi:hypothetical protein